jgi:transcriptional regulator with XRE-family HTH domain
MEVTGREIARRTGVSRVVVDAIASGRRSPTASLREKLRREAKPAVEETARAVCPICGVWVSIPCVVCAARAREAQHSPADRLAEAVRLLEEPIVIGLDLRGDARQRYQEIRARKIAAGEVPTSGQFSLRRAKREGWVP